MRSGTCRLGIGIKHRAYVCDAVGVDIASLETLVFIAFAHTQGVFVGANACTECFSIVSISHHVRCWLNMMITTRCRTFAQGNNCDVGIAKCCRVSEILAFV